MPVSQRAGVRVSRNLGRNSPGGRLLLYHPFPGVPFKDSGNSVTFEVMPTVRCALNTHPIVNRRVFFIAKPFGIFPKNAAYVQLGGFMFPLREVAIPDSY